MNESIDTYGLTLPNAWNRLPLERSEQQAATRSLITELSAHDGWTKTMERQIDLSIARLNTHLAKLNTVMAAVYWDVWPADRSAEGDEVPAQAIAASCVLGTLSKDDLQTTFDLTPGMLLSAIAIPPPGKERRADTTGVDVEPPTIVELPAGRAVRIRRHHETRVDLARAEGSFVESYLIPHDEEGERICVLSFSTTNEELATDFSKLFDRMARTLRFFRADDDTIATLVGPNA